MSGQTNRLMVYAFHQAAVASINPCFMVHQIVTENRIQMPLGNGHEALGRYAKGVSVNAFKILDSVFDKETGELAMHETRVKVSKAGQRVVIVKDEGPAGGNQMGRKIAVRMSSNKVNLSEEV